MDVRSEEEALRRQLDDDEGLAACLGSQAGLLRKLGDPIRASMLLMQAESLFRKLGSSAGLATTLLNRASLLLSKEDSQAALPLLEEAERLFREIEDPDGIVASLNRQVSILSKGRQQGARALELADEAMRLVETNGLQHLREFTLVAHRLATRSAGR